MQFIRFVFLLIFIISSFSSNLYSQFVIKGIVKDSSDKALLIGASIRDEVLGKGTVTNENGEFELILESLPSNLVISHVSYQTKKVKVNVSDFLTVNLTQRTILLPEIVVGNEAEKIMNEVIKNVSRDKDTYNYKAFFQKISLDGDTFTKIHELFFDVQYKNGGVQRIHPTNSRYAELTNQRFEHVNLFRQSLYYVRMIDSTLNFPISPQLQNTRSYKLDSYLLTETGNRIAVINCKIISNSSSFVGQIFVDTDINSLQRIEGTFYDENQLVQSQTEIVLNYRINEKSGLASFDHLQLIYTLQTKGIEQLTFTEKAWLLFLEEFPKEQFENTKSYSPFQKSIQKKIKQTPYSSQFWNTNIPIKHTNISQEVIQEIEKNGLFKSNYN